MTVDFRDRYQVYMARESHSAWIELWLTKYDLR
jgi:hypothetical protein